MDYVAFRFSTNFQIIALLLVFTRDLYGAFDQESVSFEPGYLFARQLNLLCQFKCNAMLHYPAVNMKVFQGHCRNRWLLSFISTLDRLKRAGRNVKEIIPDCSTDVMIACANTNTGEGCYYGIILSDTEACALLLSFIVWMLLVVFCCATFVENEIPNFLIRFIRPFPIVQSSVIMCISDLISPKQAVIVTAKLSARHQSLGRSIIRMVHWGLLLSTEY